MEWDAGNVVEVKLPPLFVNFAARKAPMNKHYQAVREESEQWLIKTCKFDTNMASFIHKTDFGYFVAIVAPDTEEDKLRTMFDWGNWVFPFDDAFDNGELKVDLDGVRRMMDELLTVMDNKVTFRPTDPLVVAFKSIWDRLSDSNCSAGTLRRFARSMQDYSEACIQQVIMQSRFQGSETLSVDEFIAMRRGSIATTPLFALFEYAYGLNIPDEVFECSSIKELERVSTEVTVIQNDIVSYRKEQLLDENSNLIKIYLRDGFSVQAAFDEAGKLLATCYRDWYLALADLPSWGEDVDAQVQTYIEGLQNVVLANIHWSFRAERYWKSNAEIQKDRTIEVRLT
ncbi:terpene synthase metal binding domain protein [Aspergillus costaricaensis CBS 115574]|uniref:Terpene synthase metal binding domain protein n=1 Tax=Aspergillus costaricaensis CBS 115574 TaxID=1448317 RepID=A0ACD1IVV1_9EURO|nr:terpene synthase metal binding domain protein [Aspergillus costaricaensis CBS 115574]RAK94265.1 terpene synthase metal binding domain protein [Aspergillus costaricaensis CBS 115574]